MADEEFTGFAARSQDARQVAHGSSGYGFNEMDGGDASGPPRLASARRGSIPSMTPLSQFSADSEQSRSVVDRVSRSSLTARDFEAIGIETRKASARVVRARWTKAINKVKAASQFIKGLQTSRDEISVTAINISDGIKPIKALQKALKKAKAPAMNAISHADLGTGVVTEVKRFMTDDLVVIDYGTKWAAHADLSFRVGLRHGEHDEVSKSKRTILLFEADDMKAFTNQEKLNILKSEKSTSSRIPYVRVKAKVMVLYKDDAADQGGIGSCYWIPLDEFFNSIVLNVTQQKNHKALRSDIGVKRLQMIMERKLKEASSENNPGSQRRDMLNAVQAYMIENDILFTESNLAKLLKAYRDVKCFDDMIELIAIRKTQFDDDDAGAATRGESGGLSTEVQHYYALALSSRGQPGDLELAEEIAVHVCLKAPDFKEMQGLKGKMFKKKFMQAFADPTSDPKEMEKARAQAAEAYTRLSEIELAEPNTIPTWSFSNLTVLLFACENVKESEFKIWQNTDTLTQMLSGKLELQTLNFWDTSTLLGLDVIAGYLFKNPMLFMHANRVLAHLMTLPSQTWMLETLLVDLRFTHAIHTNRGGSGGEGHSVEELRYNWWVNFLEMSVGNADHGEKEKMKKQLVLVTTNVGLEDYSKMMKTYISIQEPRGGGRALKVEGGFDQPNCVVQMSLAVRGDGDWHKECPLKTVDIQDSNISKPNQPGVLDERRIIISSTSTETGINEIFTVIFPSSDERSKFWEVAKGHGYTNEKEMSEMLCPPHTFWTADDSDSKIVLGEGSFATVFLGAVQGEDGKDNSRLVAIKQMKEEFLSVPHAMADFLSEIGKLRQMKHKNIIEFLGAEKDNGVLNTYLMELVDGGDLGQMVDVVGPLFVDTMRENSVEAIAAYAAQIVSGVEYLHTGHSICHRDLKPANALVDSQSGKLKLNDFGTVQDLGGLDSKAFELVGSLPYADPQVLMGVPYGLEVDIFSVGSTIWELAGGKMPYSDIGGMDALMEHRRANPKELLPMDPAWPAELRDFIVRCFAPKSTRPDASELLKDKFMLHGLDIANNHWARPMSQYTATNEISNQLADVLKEHEDEIVAAWCAAIAETPSDAALATTYREEIISLLQFIGDLLDSDNKTDPLKIDEVWAKLKALISDGVAPEDEFTRARDFVIILKYLSLPKPPVTAEGSNDARENTHFLMKVIKKTDYFSKLPHTVWVCETCLNDMIENTIRDILPSASKRYTPYRESDISEGSGGVAVKAMMLKMDQILDHLNSAAPQGRTLLRQKSHKNSDVRPELREFCEANGIGDEWAAVLAAQEITPALLKRDPPVLSRADLTELGIPLGVVATLLPR